MRKMSIHSLGLVGIIALSIAIAFGSVAHGSMMPKPMSDGDPIRLIDIQMMDTHIGWGRSRDHCVVRSEDSGSHWLAVTPPPIAAETGYIDCIPYFLDEAHAWVVQLDVGDVATIFHTDNGGSTWSGGTSVPIRYGSGSARVDFVDPRHGWLEVQSAGMGALQAELFRTRDGGASWVKVSGTRGEGPSYLPFGGEIRFLDADTGWLAGAPRAAGGPPVQTWFYRTDDGGVSWEHQDVPIPPGHETSVVSMGTPAFFGRLGGVMSVRFQGEATWTYATEDGGRHWTPIGPQPEWGQVEFVSPEDGWLAGTEGLYQTRNGGRSWDEVPPNATLHAAHEGRYVAKIDFVDNQTGWMLLRPTIRGDEAGPAPLLLFTRDAGRTYAIAYG